jgi:hypothetical protein
MRRSAGQSGPQPLPQSLVAELIEAGISPSTVLAMEGWKAQEVVELLRSSRRRETARWGGGPGESPAAPLGVPQ